MTRSAKTTYSLFGACWRHRYLSSGRQGSRHRMLPSRLCDEMPLASSRCHEGINSASEQVITYAAGGQPEEREGVKRACGQEGFLHAVAVVDVDVNVQHPLVVLEQLQDRQHNVIDIAKS